MVFLRIVILKGILSPKYLFRRGGGSIGVAVVYIPVNFVLVNFQQWVRKWPLASLKKKAKNVLPF